ncbi:hypothetical protein TRAPUB_10989 [Trametes pubescens]|uniref:Uncharacterized protein n=1 Tax=Trametes pubescens TaxID=154538 RepID=A0A1M2VY13_TRAPU|nr:hypothetical protein TRAPUB_10989 [Trametes pubescens]
MELAQATKPKPRAKGRKASATIQPGSSSSTISGSATTPAALLVVHPLAALDEDVQKAARKYTIFIKPWPPLAEVWPLVESTESVDPWDEYTRYPENCSDDAKAAAITRAQAAELRQLIPATILPHVTNAHITFEFSEAVLTQKSHILTSARSMRAAIFSHIQDMNHTVFVGGQAQLRAIGDDSKCQYWRSSANVEEIYPPIILPDAPPREAGRIAYMFKNKAIAKHFNPVGITTQTKYAFFLDEYTKLLVQYGSKPRVGATLEWLEDQVFAGIIHAPTRAASSVAAPGVRTRVDPRDLVELNGELSVELEEPPDLTDHYSATLPQSSASNHRHLLHPAPGVVLVPRYAPPEPAPTLGMPTPTLGMPAPALDMSVPTPAPAPFPHYAHNPPQALPVSVPPTSSQVSYHGNGSHGDGAAIPISRPTSSRVRAIPLSAVSSRGLAHPPHIDEPTTAVTPTYEESDSEEQPLGVPQHPSYPASQSQPITPDVLASALGDINLAHRGRANAYGEVLAATFPTTVDAGPLEDAPQGAATLRKGPAGVRRGRKKNGPTVRRQDIPPVGEPRESTTTGSPIEAGPTTARATRARSRAT